MSPSIASLSPRIPPTAGTSFFTDLQNKAHEIFTKIKEALVPPAQVGALERPAFNLQALYKQPFEIVEGVFYGVFCALSVYFAADSCHALYTTCRVEHRPSEQFEKIGSAIKTAFVDVVSTGTSMAYTVRWANSAKIISLGKYLPLVNYLCCGTALVVNTVEAGADLYNIQMEKEAILKAQSPLERDKHRQLLCCVFMKLVSNVSMVAWASLGIAALLGVAVSSLVTTAFLGIGCIVGIAAVFWKMKLEESSERPLVAQ